MRWWESRGESFASRASPRGFVGRLLEAARLDFPAVLVVALFIPAAAAVGWTQRAAMFPMVEAFLSLGGWKSAGAAIAANNTLTATVIYMASLVIAWVAQPVHERRCKISWTPDCALLVLIRGDRIHVVPLVLTGVLLLGGGLLMGFSFEESLTAIAMAVRRGFGIAEVAGYVLVAYAPLLGRLHVHAALAGLSLIAIAGPWEAWLIITG